jgi:hypothetical protein
MNHSIFFILLQSCDCTSTVLMKIPFEITRLFYIFYNLHLIKSFFRTYHARKPKKSSPKKDPNAGHVNTGSYYEGEVSIFTFKKVIKICFSYLPIVTRTTWKKQMNVMATRSVVQVIFSYFFVFIILILETGCPTCKGKKDGQGPSGSK